MLLEHLGKRPRAHPSAWIAANATIAGDVSIGEGTRVLFGAVLVAEGGPVTVGRECVVMENAVVRGVARWPATVGDHVLVGPHAHVSGATVADDVFIATGAALFNGARVGTRATVRIHGIVHIRTTIPEGGVVPIGWVAVGDPAEILPPSEHERISALLRERNFPQTVWGLDYPPPGGTIMPEAMRRYARGLGRHRDDRQVDG